MKHRLLLLILFVFAISVAGWAQSTAPSYTVKGVLIIQSKEYLLIL